MKFADRIQRFQANVFADMDQAKRQALDTGQSLIDLSLGSSDLPVAAPILETISQSLQDPSTHGYLLFHGTRSFREAVAAWYEQRFGLSVDPETEVLPLIGSQEGTAHLPLAILNPGDIALLQDPGYPSHAGGVYLAGGEMYGMPLLAENQFLPVFSEIPTEVRQKARMMVLSYPHNPTTAIAPLSFFQEAVQFCQDHDLVLVHDFPYVDFVFSEQKMPSILQADRHRQCSIEFFTFSKSYSMGGFRIGFAVGNADLITSLRKIKAIVDFNQYLGILNGAVTALKTSDAELQQTLSIFQKRRDVFVTALAKIGWVIPKPTATMYIWAPLPEPWQQQSVEFCKQLVLQTGVAASPGAGFGPAGEGYVRFALVQDPDTLNTAVDRIDSFLHT
ncbi:LL-diaminopimelate aminotransferase [Acaryochloris marina]|uniref:Aspartate aminotransferase n=1 Tax=Acaryochloris marina (strain MBIC 11017) TaxID=329726 RepID=B0C9G8_ACAM1|nr:LL-diaminopimelate aminotransferase [Acaryochloris marina]ABW28981.1 aspartate aminotransferase [Acaryochloris marina MBIC11017]BDM77952.1 succinyldiaminopimelate aminotransferase [Acaryochloris marina MBIC10699]